VACLCEGTVPLPDGRRLGYAEYGVRGGRPILHFHGQPGGRFYDLDRGALVAHDAWLITLERPATGLSDPKPGRTLLDWADDVANAADHFGIDRFAVLGTSAGAPYALACGYVLDQRVAAIGLQCGYCGMPGDPEVEAVDPLAEEQARYGADPRAYLDAARTRLQGRCDAWARDPDAFFDAFLAFWPENDRPRFAANRDRWMRMLAATYGVPADVDEDRIDVDARGFALEDVKQAVHAWHGADDHAVPVALTEVAVRRIPNGEITVYPGAGHYLGPSHHGDYLDFLTNWDRV